MSGKKPRTLRQVRTAPSRAEKSAGTERELSRREWLGGVTAVAATAAFAQTVTEAQGRDAAPYRIDTHHHHSQGGGWTPSRSLEAMDRSGIAAAILSRPNIPVSEPEAARKLARETNEYAAQVVRDHPSRFGLFASLPLFDVDGSLREIANSFDVLKADGVCMATNYANKWPGDPTFAPVFDELNRRKAVVFIHPTAPTFYRAADFFNLQPAALEFMFDSARAIVSLILSGTLVRCPEIRFIFGHGGGTLPFVHERLDHLIAEDPPTGGEWTTGDNRFRSKYVPNGFLNEMKKVYFDVVRVANPPNFALLTKVMPPEHLLLGTDYPIVPTAETVGHLTRLPLDSRQRRGIERDNALALFPRFKA